MRFISPQPTPEEIEQLYHEEYFKSTVSGVRPHGKSDYFSSVESAEETRIYQRRLAEFAEHAPTGTLLEIGCGPGHFLKTATENGWVATGVEISEFASDFARKTFSLNIHTGTIDDISFAPASFDVIFLGDLLEHVLNPRKLLLKLQDSLRPDGILYIEVPAVTNGLFSRLGSMMLKAMGKTKIINLPPYHLFEFTPENCRNLLKMTGYSTLSVQQKVVPPNRIGLRESFLMNGAKLLFQTANYLITALTGRYGDRLTIIARKTVAQ